MSLLTITAPTSEIVSLAEARAQLRVTDSAEDARIAGLILAARLWAEEYTVRKIPQQTLEYRAESFCDEIELGVAPVQSITSIKYMSGGVETTIAGAEYEADLSAHLPTIRPADGYSWPTPDMAYNAVRVRFVCGYDAAAPEIHLAREAMLLHIEAHFDRDERTFETLIKAAEALLHPLRTYA